MKNFPDNKKSALMTIVILAVGAISGVATAQFVTGLDGGNINGSIIACVYGACKDNTFNGGTSGGGGQPTPNTAKLIVIKQCTQCTPSDFQITVSGVTASPSTFSGDAAGTTVTVSPGTYTVSENIGPVAPVFSGDCQVAPANLFKATGTISAGETKTCTIANSGP